MQSIDHSWAFAEWWGKNFPGTQCPPLPKKEADLGLTAQFALKSDNPALYQNLFGNGGMGSGSMPADTVARRNSGQLQGSDIPHLRAAGLEWEAQELEQRVQRQMDQRMADQALSSRENYQEAMARNAQWAEMGILERMGHQPLSPEVIAENRRRWGITGR
jgi:hypothetical protein